MDFLNEIKALIPDYAKDIRLNIDGTIARNALTEEQSIGLALACAFAAKCTPIIQIIKNTDTISETEKNGALTAASLMAMNNTWYPYTEMVTTVDKEKDNEETKNLANEFKSLKPELRMNAYANNGGISKINFETYALGASIIGKCHFCVTAHVATLKKEGFSVTQIRDIGRIAATVNAAAHVIAAQN